MGAGTSTIEDPTPTPADIQYSDSLEVHVLRELITIRNDLSDTDRKAADTRMMKQLCGLIVNVCGMLKGLPSDGSRTIEIAGSRSDTVIKVMESIRDGLSHLDTPVSREILQAVVFDVRARAF